MDLKDTNLHSVNISEDRVVLVHVEDRMLRDSFLNENNTEVFKLFWTMKGTSPIGMTFPWNICKITCHQLILDKFEELMKVAKEPWDLIAIDPLFTPCAYLIAKISGASVIMFGTSFPLFSTATAKNIPQPLSYYPSLHVAAKDFSSLRFYDRLDNTFNDLISYFVHKFINRVVQATLNGHYDDFSFAEFEGDAVLSTSVFPMELDYAKPLIPDLLTFYTVCPTSKPLPADLLEFVNDPKSKGTLVMAFGHGVRWSGALPSQMSAMEEALDQLTDYRIIWQCDVVDTRPQENRRHIRRVKWLPQTDLLFHERTKVFLSHGGLKSVTESVCAEVPFVAMPQFAEQYRNAILIVERGLGLMLDKFELSGESVKSTLIEVINNPKYKHNSRKMGQLIRDKPIPGHNYAAFGFEMAARQKQRLNLLHNRGAKLSVIKYFNLDVIISTGGSSLLAAYLLIKLIVTLLHNLCGKQKRD